MKNLFAIHALMPLALALAAQALGAAMTVESPLKAATNYTFTIPYCGTNGIHGRLLSLSATNAPIRVEDRAFLAEAEAERIFYTHVGSTNYFVNAKTNYQSRWRFHDGNYDLCPAYSRTNATYSPSLVETSSQMFSIPDVAAAIGADLEPAPPTNVVLRLAAHPTNVINLISAGPVKAAYTNFTPFRAVGDAHGDAVLADTRTQVYDIAGDLYVADRHQESTATNVRTNSIDYIENIYNKSVRVDKWTWALYKGGESDWSLERSGTATSYSTDETETVLQHPIMVPIYSTNAAPSSVKQCAVVIYVTVDYLRPTPHSSYYTSVTKRYAYATSASVVHRSDGVFASVQFDLPALASAAISAAGATKPDISDVKAEIPPLAPPQPPPGPAVQDMEVDTYGGSSDARSWVSVYADRYATVVVDIEPKALHPQWNASQPQ